MLSCEVVQAKMEVTWFKDGKKLGASSRVHVEAKGCRRQLVVQQVGEADAGEYSCEAAGQKVSFYLQVKGQSLLGPWCVQHEPGQWPRPLLLPLHSVTVPVFTSHFYKLGRRLFPTPTYVSSMAVSVLLP